MMMSTINAACGRWMAARGLLFNVKYIKKWCSALFTSKKSVLHTKKIFFYCCAKSSSTPHQLCHVVVEGKTTLCAQPKKEICAGDNGKKVPLTLAVRSSSLYIITYSPHPHKSTPTHHLHCVFSYVYISQQNLLSSSQMAKWIVVDVTVRVVLFSTIAFVVNFLDNFFFFLHSLCYCCFFHHTRGKFVFSFYIFFIFHKIATGFLLCYFCLWWFSSSFYVIFFLHRERFLSHLVGCWWEFFMSKFSLFYIKFYYDRHH